MEEANLCKRVFTGLRRIQSGVSLTEICFSCPVKWISVIFSNDAWHQKEIGKKKQQLILLCTIYQKLFWFHILFRIASGVRHHSENCSVIILTFFFQALFWQQQNYYGVDLTPLHGTAFQGYFSQVICFLKFTSLFWVVPSWTKKVKCDIIFHSSYLVLLLVLLP